MSSAMISAVVATCDRPGIQLPEFESGYAAVGNLTDVDIQEFDDNAASVSECLADLIEEHLEDVHTQNYLTGAGEPTRQGTTVLARQLIDDLRDALLSSEIDERVVGGYRLYFSGGPSYGDAPTEAFTAISNIYLLPDVVLSAMRLIRDYSKPLN